MTDLSGLILDVTSRDAAPDKEFLEKLGHPVGHACPILKGGCPMVDAAHGVIFQLDLDRPQHRAILKRYQEVLTRMYRSWPSLHPNRKRSTPMC